MLPTLECEGGERVHEAAAAVLETLFMAVADEQPMMLRAYQEDDALLVLLRFRPELLEHGGEPAFEPLVDISLIAMPELIAKGVQERTGRRLAPGNLSVCAERGLAVFAFAVLDEPDTFELEDLLSAGSTVRLVPVGR